jgi:hypothetical protein
MQQESRAAAGNVRHCVHLLLPSGGVAGERRLVEEVEALLAALPGRVFPVLAPGAHREEWALELSRTYDAAVFERIHGGVLAYGETEIPFEIVVKDRPHSIVASLPGECLEIFERVKLRGKTSTWPDKLDAPLCVNEEESGIFLRHGPAIEVSFEREAKEHPFWTGCRNALEDGLLVRDQLVRDRTYLIHATEGGWLLRALANVADLRAYLGEVADPKGLNTWVGLHSGRVPPEYRDIVRAIRYHRADEIEIEAALAEGRPPEPPMIGVSAASECWGRLIAAGKIDIWERDDDMDPVGEAIPRDGFKGIPNFEMPEDR